MNEWVWSNGRLILTGENWSAGRKTLYSVGGRWMNEYGAMVEWYWQGKTEVLGEKHYTVWVVDGWMSREQWWNDTDRGKLKYGGKNIIQRGWYMNEWLWSNGGMILTGENWSIGRKTLYSMGGRWMNEYGAMVEWYWQGKTEELGEKHYIAWVVHEWMIMEQWWNDTDRGKLKYWGKDLSITNPAWTVSELHRPFALSEQQLTSQTLNVQILFSCYIARKDNHIIDKMCLIIICNWRIILKEVLVRVRE